jgi:hypothetical protein
VAVVRGKKTQCVTDAWLLARWVTELSPFLSSFFLLPSLYLTVDDDQAMLWSGKDKRKRM